VLKTQGMHVNTELRESPSKVFLLRCLQNVMCVSLVSLFWCVSAFVHFFPCTDVDFEKVLLLFFCKRGIT